MNFIEPTGNLGILLTVPTLKAPDFSLRRSYKAVLNVSKKISREGVVAYLWLSLCVGLHQAFREFLLLREYGGGTFDPSEYLSS
jgi:hypothetical protein